MELKRVIALDSRTANEKAIQLYGENVLVISSERVDNQVELIVAVDLEPDASDSLGDTFAPAPAPAASAAAPHARPVAPEPAEPESAHQSHVHSPQAGLMSFSDWLQRGVEPVGGASVRIRQTPLKPVRPAAPRDTRAAQSPTHAAPPAQPAAPSPADETDAAAAEQHHDQLRSREVLALVRQEFDLLRRDLLTARAFAATAPADSTASRWLQQLAELAVPLALRTQLVAALDGSEDAESAVDRFEQSLAGWLERCHEASSPAHKAGPGGKRPRLAEAAHGSGARIEVLVGPSGCGKTSMAVRLAAQAAAAGGAAQAVVSFRDTRPGAWSQLQMLCGMAGVDCWRAQNADSLKVILAELGGHETVWVDTGGLDYMDTAQVLHELCPQAAMHAVLPLDASLSSSRRMLAESPLAWTSLMLSKTDESGHAWPLIATLCEHPRAVSWLGASDRVQVPARRFDARALAAAVLAPLRQGAQPSPAVANRPADAPARDAGRGPRTFAPQPAVRAEASAALGGSTLASLSRRASTTMNLTSPGKRAAAADPRV